MDFTMEDVVRTDTVKESKAKKPYICGVCEKQFTVPGRLKTHIFQHITEGPYICSICDKRFYDASACESHVLEHTKETPYTCYICEKYFSDSRSLTLHFLKHSVGKPHVCCVCDKQFIDPSSLALHSITHSRDNSQRCSVCGKEIFDANTLAFHKIVHSGYKPYSCFVCEKQFTQASRLEAHISIHTGEEKPYVCFICECGFSELGNLTRHMLKHAETLSNKRTKCENPSCRPFTLRNHAFTHIHTCITCGKMFDDAYSLKSHMICEKQCSLGTDLKISVLMHPEKPPGDSLNICHIREKQFTLASDSESDMIPTSGEESHINSTSDSQTNVADLRKHDVTMQMHGYENDHTYAIKKASIC